jgi:threonine/homoserine/homoserine lactone efflux protein
MAGTLFSFLGVAVLVSLVPGPATALVVRSAAVHGRREAFQTVLGNSTGILGWALASVLGISALVAASEAAFTTLRALGAIVLIWLGVQALRGSKGEPASVLRPARKPYAQGLLTSAANPKLAVFFIALFPQFVGERGDVLPTTLAMAAMIVCFDFVWYSTLAVLASRAKAGFMRTRPGRWLERVTGGVLIALGVRVALES